MSVGIREEWRVCKVATHDGANWHLRAVSDVAVEPPLHCLAKVVSDGLTGHCACSECGGAIDFWDRFCRHCGREVRGKEVTKI